MNEKIKALEGIQKRREEYQRECQEYARRTRERREKYQREYQKHQEKSKPIKVYDPQTGREVICETLLPDEPNVLVFPLEKCMKRRGAPASMLQRLQEILEIFSRFAKPNCNAYFNYSFYGLVDELKSFRCGVPNCCRLPKTIAIVARRFPAARLLPGSYGSRQ